MQNNRRARNDGADRGSGVSVSPFFDCTRHYVRRKWSKWRDLGDFGDYPPRRGGPFVTRWPPSPIQPGRFVSRAAPGPNIVSTGGNRKTKTLRRPTTHGIISMGISCLPRPQASRKRLASDRGPSRGQQALTDAKNEDGDPVVSSTDSQAGRPLGLFRLEGWVLFFGHRPEGQRSFHCQPRRAVVAILRVADGVVVKSVRI